MDRELLKKLLRDIEYSLDIAGGIVEMDLNSFLSDIRNIYTLRLAIIEVVEASTSLGLHILRELGERHFDGYIEVFRRLVEKGVISPEIGQNMMRLARLRNLIIHRYWVVDDTRIYDEARGNGLEAVKKFIEEVERYASGD